MANKSHPASDGPSRSAHAQGLSVAPLVVTAVFVGAILVAYTLLSRHEEGPAEGARPTSAGPSKASVAGLVAFPDATLIAGTSTGSLYKVQNGHVIGRVQACIDGSVLAVHVSAQTRLALVVCSGAPRAIDGSVVLVDVATMTPRPISSSVLNRSDVAAWSPDGRSIALLRSSSCNGSEPCLLHVALWDIATNATRTIRPAEGLVFDLLWTDAGLSVAIPQGRNLGTWVWDGQGWSRYSTHILYTAMGTDALLLESTPATFGGTVWRKTGDSEHQLTTSGVEFALGVDGDRAFVARDETPLTPIVVYRGAQIERVTELPGMCLSAERWGRWLICTNAGSAVLAYSLDSLAAARLLLTEVGEFTAIGAVPLR